MSFRTLLVLGAAVAVGVFGLSSSPVLSANADAGTGPQLKSGGPLAFGPDGILFIADTQAAAIYALEMGDRLIGGQAGTKEIAGIDQQIAARLGTDARGDPDQRSGGQPCLTKRVHLRFAWTGRQRRVGPGARGRRREHRDPAAR